MKTIKQNKTATIATEYDAKPNFRLIPESEMSLLISGLRYDIEEHFRTRRRPKPKEKPP